MSSHDELLDTLRDAQGEGLSLADLQRLYPDVPRRSLQRRIQSLLYTRLIHAAGQARARRYYFVEARRFFVAEEPEDTFPGAIPLSADSRDIVAYVSQPIQARKPVGYQRDFLDAYEPNKTWYLPEPLRRQLRRIGDTGETERPAGTYGRAILSRLLIDLSWASSHLEGNTYTRLDTRELIEHGRAARGKSASETQMILNHKAAIELLVDDVEDAAFDRHTLLNLHGALAENLLADPLDEARVRQHGVYIGKSVYRPLNVPTVLDELLTVLLDKAARITDPYEQSFFVMVHLPYLQPFSDVNKRTSRLAANLPLLKGNLSPLTFLDVPERAYSRAMLGVYEMTRVELLRDVYLWAYERSAQEYVAVRRELVEPDPLRLAYREVIRQVVREVVMAAEAEPLTVIASQVAQLVGAADRDNVHATIVEELRRLHEGTLARYRLRPGEFRHWRERQAARHAIPPA